MNEKLIEIDHAQLWTEKRGEGSIPVILISGGPGTCNYLEPLSTLIDEVCEVIMFDPRGCGRSSDDGNGYDLASCLRDIEWIRKAYGFKKWLVIGHSWGADVGLAYSLLYSRSILGYVSISGTGIQNDRDWKDSYSRNKIEIGELTPNFKYEVNTIVHRSLIDSWRTFIKNPNLLKDISHLDLPTLFIYAENDIRPSWPIKQISALINNSKYIEIEGAEHYVWLSKKIALAKILRDFIKNFESCITRDINFPFE
ncbi:alpha/beta hydrolase [Solibacillus sp. MA9]|uniref:Alpha/beta hydrolase n=1 Tax=Solibacillus palustris TaxID=2908203 RepID=A0ABS9UBV5_9BACL|nr:alpha/beta hydrolase [Solibacillus sp. MA9]MCH7321827.1 alpha/beta hydrolase [Solibacillus sp. MA9]